MKTISRNSRIEREGLHINPSCLLGGGLSKPLKTFRTNQKSQSEKKLYNLIQPLNDKDQGAITQLLDKITLRQ